MSKSMALTQREAAYLEHRRRAAAEHVPLSEYCRRNGLRVGEWYQVQRGLARKAAVNPKRSADGPAAGFAPVRFTGSAVLSATAVPMGCRIRHPSGWTIECVNLPPANWLNELVLGVR